MNRYFVVEPERVVADDLAHAIRANDPCAVVEVFRAVAEVWAVLRRARPKAVILGLDPKGFADTELGRELVAGRIPHAFLRLVGGDWSEGEIVLGSPFSEATVGALLRALACRSD